MPLNQRTISTTSLKGCIQIADTSIELDEDRSLAVFFSPKRGPTRRAAKSHGNMAPPRGQAARADSSSTSSLKQKTMGKSQKEGP